MDKVCVLDFGGQYCHLIANRVRRLGVYCEIKDGTLPAAEFLGYKGIILSGGPASVYAPKSPKCDPKIFEFGIPVLGICYGHQLIAYFLKGRVKSGSVKEYGDAQLQIHWGHYWGRFSKRTVPIFPIFKNLKKGKIKAWMSHGDTLSKLPAGFTVLASTKDCKYAAIGDLKRNIYGTQFHIEVTHTPLGMKILSNFLDICGCKREWSISKFLEQEFSAIKEKADSKKVFFLVSGGVDSTVAFALLNRSLGEKHVYGLFVDTGLLRKNEVENTAFILRKLGFHNFHIVNAKKVFLKALASVVHPEEKRRIIGDLFLKIYRKTILDLKLNPREWIFGQGTIYPDTIETGGTKYAAKIKTHHNRVPEIQEMIKKGALIEPLKELYKDEVRMVGRKLGLPDSIVGKHPFPGPGLAVRILCQKKGGAVLRFSSAEAGRKKQKSSKVQRFLNKVRAGYKCFILPIKSVGVQGDARTYCNPLLIFGGKLDFGLLNKISTELTNRFKNINRVCYLISSKKVFSVKPVKAFLTEKRIRFLQDCDNIVMQYFAKTKLMQKIWQCPIVLLPFLFDNRKSEAVVLRPVASQEAMTANFYKVPKNHVKNIVKKLNSLKNPPSAILYDITNKPPATIEWE